jgi:hypothetical protein
VRSLRASEIELENFLQSRSEFAASEGGCTLWSPSKAMRSK